MSATLSIRIYANDVDKATVGVVEWEAKAVSCSARPEQWSLSKWSLSPKLHTMLSLSARYIQCFCPENKMIANTPRIIFRQKNSHLLSSSCHLKRLIIVIVMSTDKCVKMNR